MSKGVGLRGMAYFGFKCQLPVGMVKSEGWFDLCDLWQG